MKFICETCEKKYDTPEAAAMCEKSHEVDDAKNVEAKAISDAVNEFYAKYGVLPNIELNDATRQGLHGEFIHGLSEVLTALAEALNDDDDDADDDCCECCRPR